MSYQSLYEILLYVETPFSEIYTLKVGEYTTTQEEERGIEPGSKELSFCLCSSFSLLTRNRY